MSGVYSAAEPAAADPRWKAIMDRDNAWDGRFVFCVRTTGIYCRPSCPARRPKPDRIEFLDSPEEAEGKGYRPCRRCRPRETAAIAHLLDLVCRHIDAHLDEPLDIRNLGELAGVSPARLRRLFRLKMGVSPRAYLDARRMERFRHSLRMGEGVIGAMLDAGYSSTSRIHERSSPLLGMPPSIYRKGGKGLRVVYTIVDSPLGRMLVAATPVGVCAVSLGDTDDELLRALHAEFPAAEIEPDDVCLRRAVDMLLPSLDGGPAPSDLPLDVRGTAFQRQVWDALRSIPRGETRSYGEVARGMGRPDAVRAVAGACASNQVAIAIPCHRAIRGDGGMGGYRWGLDRKRMLLDRERTDHGEER